MFSQLSFRRSRGIGVDVLDLRHQGLRDGNSQSLHAQEIANANAFALCLRNHPAPLDRRRRNSPRLSPAPEDKLLPSAPREACESVSFHRQWKARSALAFTIRTGKLVRVLHQQAELNEFAIGADALVTQWDGKNDDDEDLPAGKYHAHGYLVGPSR